MKELDHLHEEPGPWGNSPETIASWFWPKTKLSAIVESILEGNQESIERMNALFITLWISHRIHKDSYSSDILSFIDLLKSEIYIHTFSEKVSNIIINKVWETEWENIRSFLEGILFTKDDSPSHIISEYKLAHVEWEDGFVLEKEINDILIATIKTLGYATTLTILFLFLGL